jgi:uncharacterized protein YjeT (DUF2065 family)
MRDFSVAIGLVLAIEGLDPGKLRGIGLGAAFVGVGIVWASRSLL